jgi:hypothetical protein
MTENLICMVGALTDGSHFSRFDRGSNVGPNVPQAVLNEFSLELDRAILKDFQPLFCKTLFLHLKCEINLLLFTIELVKVP